MIEFWYQTKIILMRASLRKQRISGIHPDVRHWVNRVSSASDSVSFLGLTVISKFVSELSCNGIWQKLRTGHVNPIASNSSLGVHIPLVAPSGTTQFINGAGLLYSLNTGLNRTGNFIIETGFIPNVHLANPNSAQISFYDNLSSGSHNNRCINESGAIPSAGNWGLVARTTGNLLLCDCFTISDRHTATSNSSLGLNSGSRINANDLRLYKNGSQIGSTRTATQVGSTPSVQMILRYDTTTHANNRCCYFYIGAGLTFLEEAIHFRAVHRFNTLLGRAANI